MSVPRFSTRDQGERGNASNRVVVVAARFALDEYLKYSAYICQPYRTFQHCVRMAFYKRNTIDHRIPKILGNIEAISRDEIEIRTDLAESERVMLRTLLTKMDSTRSEDWRTRQYKIVFLTSPDSPDTLVLPSDIVNTLTSKSGNVLLLHKDNVTSHLLASKGDRKP
jgi:hypothetical protein